MSAEEYIQELLEERDTLDPGRYGHALRLINDEMRRVRSGRPVAKGGPQQEFSEPQFKEEVAKLTEKLLLPIEQFPHFNFVGRLLGPGGSIMKEIADTTRTKISILGKGSMKDKSKEEELAKSDDAKHEHLKEPLHVLIQVDAPKSEAHARVADALEVIKNALLPQPNEQAHDLMGEPSHNNYRQGPPEHRHEQPPSRGRGGGGRGRGRGGGRPENPPARKPAPVRDEYGFLPTSRYEESGPSARFDAEPRGGYRPGEKRAAPANGYNNKKFRDDPYAEDSYHFNAARY